MITMLQTLLLYAVFQLKLSFNDSLNLNFLFFIEEHLKLRFEKYAKKR